jgi:hypothetical protein
MFKQTNRLFDVCFINSIVGFNFQRPFSLFTCWASMTARQTSSLPYIQSEFALGLGLL